MRSFATVAVASVLALGGLSACGDDEDGGDTTAGGTTTTAASTAAKAPSSVPDLTPFLMRKGEEPGFEPGAAPGATPQSRDTISGVAAFAQEMRLDAAEERRLRSEGFISFTVEPIRAPKAAGVMNVALYRTAKGAEHSLAHDLRPDVIRAFGPVKGLKFFTVPGVPGARGWTATDPPVGNVQWVQGRCMFVLGNQSSGPKAGLLSAGVRAIHKRTQGRCP